MGSMELSDQLQLDFKKLEICSGMDVVPVVVQHIETKAVLILAYVNEPALKESISQKRAVFWSTSRNELWVKGATSGDYLELHEIRVNCEQNSLLFLVKPVTGGVCHTKNESGQARSTCYYRRVNDDYLLEIINDVS